MAVHAGCRGRNIPRDLDGSKRIIGQTLFVLVPQQLVKLALNTLPQPILEGPASRSTLRVAATHIRASRQTWPTFVG